MTIRFTLIALAVSLPAASFAATDYNAVVAQAKSSPAQAASLYDAFCFGGTPTPQWVCDEIRAAERPVYAPKFQGPTRLKAN